MVNSYLFLFSFFLVTLGLHCCAPELALVAVSGLLIAGAPFTAECELSSCDPLAQLSSGICALPGPRIKSVLLELADWFLTTGPPRTSSAFLEKNHISMNGHRAFHQALDPWGTSIRASCASRLWCGPHSNLYLLRLETESRILGQEKQVKTAQAIPGEEILVTNQRGLEVAGPWVISQAWRAGRWDPPNGEPAEAGGWDDALPRAAVLSSSLTRSGGGI